VKYDPAGARWSPTEMASWAILSRYRGRQGVKAAAESQEESQEESRQRAGFVASPAWEREG